MELIALQMLPFLVITKKINIICSWKEHLCIKVYSTLCFKVYPFFKIIFWYLEIQTSILEHLLKKDDVSNSSHKEIALEEGLHCEMATGAAEKAVNLP